jgi:hypothetical protein
VGKFDTILDKLKKAASQRDASTAKKKCPLGKKPAIFVAVLRGDTGDPVSGVKIDISKPTTKTETTNGDGEVKVDPAKVGGHGVKVLLTPEQEKQFAVPKPAAIATLKGKTAIQYFVLEPLPKLVVEVKDKEGNKPMDGVRVRAGLRPEASTAGGKVDFGGGIPAGKYRVTVTPDKPLETLAELFHRNVSQKVFDPGYSISWDVDLPYGDSKTYTVVLAKVRSVEFILAEHGTDKPIAGAKLHAKLPGGGTSVVTTNEVGSARVTFGQDGKVEILKIEAPDSGSITKVETR